MVGNSSLLNADYPTITEKIGLHEMAGLFESLTMDFNKDLLSVWLSRFEEIVEKEEVEVVEYMRIVKAMTELLGKLESTQSTLTSIHNENTLTKRTILAIITCSSKLVLQNASPDQLTQLSTLLHSPVTQRAIVYDSFDGLLLQLLSKAITEDTVFEDKAWVEENFAKA